MHAANEYYNFFFFYENPLKHACWLCKETMVLDHYDDHHQPNLYSV
jgi:hypothetical protein